jgi:hypothetical protein
MNPNKALWKKGNFTQIAAKMRESEVKKNKKAFRLSTKGF